MNINGSPSNVGTSGDTVSGSRGANGQRPSEPNLEKVKKDYDKEYDRAQVNSLGKYKAIKGGTFNEKDTNRSIVEEITSPSNSNKDYLADPPGTADEKTQAKKLTEWFATSAFRMRKQTNVPFDSELMGKRNLQLIVKYLRDSENSTVKRYEYYIKEGIGPQGKEITTIFMCDKKTKAFEPLPFEGNFIRHIQEVIDKKK